MRNASLPLLGGLLLLLGAAFYFLLGPTDAPEPSPGLGPALAHEQDPAASRTTDLDALETLGTGEQRREVAADAPSLATSDQATKAATLQGDRPGIRGRVVDAGGSPVGGARVVAAGMDGMPLDVQLDSNLGFGQRWSTQARADGTFELQGPGPGALRLGARQAGFAPLDVVNLTLPAGGGADFGDLVLEQSVVLEGRVVVAGGGPVAGAELFAEAVDDGGGFQVFFQGLPQRPLAVTDGAGRFRVDTLAAGPWKLRVESDAQPDRRFEGRTERPGERHGDLEFQLEPGATIAGRVTGAPADGLDGLVVRATPKGGQRFGPLGSYREAEVAADGSFSVGGCKPGDAYTVQARVSEDAGPMWGMEQKTRTASIEATGGQGGLILPWTGSTGLEFQVVAAADGRPLEDFRVSYGAGFLQPHQVEGETVEDYPDGRVLLDELRVGGWGGGGAFKVRVEAAGFEVLEREFELREGEVLAGGVLQLAAAPVVVVRVLDAATKSPVEGADVRLSVGDEDPMFDVGGMDIQFGGGEQRSHRGRTGADGRAKLTSFPGEVARLVVTHADHTRHIEDGLALPAQGGLEREVLLGVGGRVAVRVLDSFGEPLPGARVQERTPPEPQPGGQDSIVAFGTASVLGGGGPGEVTDTEGLAVFEHLTPGPHEFRLSDAEGSMGMFFFAMDEPDSDGWDRLEVSEGGEHELVLQQAPKASLTGLVLEGGQPLAAARVSLSERNEGGRGMRGFGFPGMGGDSATTDGRGSYSLEGLEPGEYVLSVTHASRVMAMEYDLVVVVGENTRDVDLPIATIEGRITGSDGSPLAGVDVEVRRAAASQGGYRSMVIMMEASDGSSVTMGAGAADPTVTDADGRYVLRGVATDVELIVEAATEAASPAQSEPLELSDGELLRGVDLVLAPAGTLEVEVLGAGEDQFPMILITPLAEDGSEGEVVRGFAMEGSESFDGLAPGRYRVEVQLVGQGFGGETAGAPQEVQVEAGVVTPVSIQL